MIYEKFKMIALVALLINIIAGCGNSGGPSIDDIPHYPNATQGESMEQSSFAGVVKGELKQFTTSDSFDEVVQFYTDALDEYEPKILSHTSELGRQTAITIQHRKATISVTLQEFTEKGTVNITFMSVGN